MEATGPDEGLRRAGVDLGQGGVGELAEEGQASQGGDPVGAELVGGVQDDLGLGDGGDADVRDLGRRTGQVLDGAELAAEDGEDVDGGEEGRVEQGLGPGGTRRRPPSAGAGAPGDEIGGREVGLGQVHLGRGPAGVAHAQSEDDGHGDGPSRPRTRGDEPAAPTGADQMIRRRDQAGGGGIDQLSARRAPATGMGPTGRRGRRARPPWPGSRPGCRRGDRRRRPRASGRSARSGPGPPTSAASQAARGSSGGPGTGLLALADELFQGEGAVPGGGDEEDGLTGVAALQAEDEIGLLDGRGGEGGWSGGRRGRRRRGP